MAMAKITSISCGGQKLIAGVSMGLVFLSSGASASTDPRFTLEEVMVKARKLEENLQEAPVAVSVFTSETIEQRGWQNLSDINGSVPNLQFTPTASVSGSTSAATIFIRGIGQTDFTLTTEPGVGVFLDGVYLARSVGSVLSILDLEMVEVLRGPQGTLFGKNTIGGAINVRTKRPADEFGGALSVTAGTFDQVDVSGSVDVPISEDLLTKFTLASFSKDGYSDRVLVGDELGGSDEVVGRATMEFAATENMVITGHIDGSNTSGDSAASALLAVNQDAGAPFLSLLNAKLSPEDQYTFDNYGTGDVYKTKGTGINKNELDVFGASVSVDWQSGSLNILSITSYRDLDAHFGRDGDNSPLLLVHTEDFYEQEQFSQEFQFSGNFSDGAGTWLVGALYFGEKGDNKNLVSFTGAFGELFGLNDPAFTLQSGGEIDNDSIGIFSQVTYDLTDKVGTTFGIRYSDDKRRFRPNQFVQEIRSAGLSSTFPEYDPILPYEWVDESYSQWDPKLGFQYQLSEDAMFYMSYSSGFKGGGFVQRVFPGREFTPTFGPEEVGAYEAGVKFTGLDNRVRLNAAIFHTDYDDLQITVFDGIAPRTVNGGEAEINGFEIELDAMLFEGLSAKFSTGYTDAQYKSVSPNATEVTLDSEFAYTPEWTVNSALSYDHYLKSFGILNFNLAWSYRSDQYLDAANSEYLHQGSYNLVDASLSFTPHNGDWSLTIGGTNLGDTEYLTGGLDSLSAFGYAEGVYAAPREWFVKAKYNF